jgi:lipopolysaccharide export system ATP-binding protein
VNFKVNAGEVVGLLGPNGAGKTTAFRCVAGLLKPGKGTVRLAGRSLDGLPLHHRARLGLGYLPQGESVFRGLSVEDNILAVLEAHHVADPGGRTRSILDRFGLLHLADRRASTLSGGEKRRVEVARAVSLEPAVLMTDEPFTGVDPIAAQELGNILQTLARDGTAVLLTDHNVHQTLKVCDRAYLLFEGKILAEGNPEELTKNPVVQQCYLGEGWGSYNEEKKE